MVLIAEDVQAVADRCAALLEDEVRTPPGYPDSLALCVLDSIWSMGVRYASVENVLCRYRAWLSARGGDADTRSSADLVADVANVGGPGKFAVDVVDNRARTSPRSGILKAEAVADAARALAGLGVFTASQLRQRHAEEEVEAAWRAVRGQRSGISWHYLLILAGVQDVKADRMVCAFVSGALPGRSVNSGEAREIVIAAHERLRPQHPDLDLRTLDHAIWSAQRRS